MPYALLVKRGLDNSVTTDPNGLTQKLNVSAFQTGLANFAYDALTVAYPDAVTEVYSFTLASAPVGTITIVYTDATKALILSATRS